MPIQKEIWAADIAANLFPNNTFITRSIDDSQYVSNKTVHLPQSGTTPTVVRNRSTFPATANQRTDITLDYDIDSYSTDPTHITDVDEMQISYDKRQSVIMDHTDTINTQIADWMLVKWAPAAAARFVPTTGGNRPATAPSATGNRKKIVLADILAAKRILDKDEVPSEGRVMVIPSDMYNDLLEIDAVISADKLGTATLPSGVVGRVLGFDIYIRSRVLYVDTTGSPDVLNPGTTGSAAGDSNAALLYHPRFVRRALGAIKVFTKEDDPQYYGDVFSAEVIAGGSKARTDQKGVVAIYEAVA